MILAPRVHRALAVAALAGAAFVAGPSAQANVKLPAVISDHMVLQEGIAAPIWGWADPGEAVTVTFAKQTLATKADANGHWEVKLAPLTTCDKPRELTVAGANTIELKDILVGEVWVCSGQSNMEFSLKSANNHDAEIAAANFPEIRLFTVPKTIALKPVEDTKSAWAATTPETVPGFTAVGYFFGRDLYQALHVPIGLIHTSWGGTPAEAWTQHDYLASDPDLKVILENADKTEANFPKAMAAYEKNKTAIETKWQEQVAKAKAEHKQLPRKPQAPQDMAHNPHSPSVLYNGMIAPIVPFAVKGSIWYQGESNSGRAWQYRKLLPAMIKSWRDAWGEPEAAFYIVSLANFQNPPTQPGDSDWAELREAQTVTANQPHNGQALAIDLANADNPSNIHPTNKQDVGKRLALVALAKTYCKPVDYSGPEYKCSKTEGGKVVIELKFADGLNAKGGTPLKGFQIAGEDKKWHWADATIDGDKVIVSSSDVSAPAAVRYDWATNPQGNLYNKADLPTVPFRTDDWPAVTFGKN